MLKAEKVSSTEFERHTLVSVDRYIAYKPREEKVNTLNELSKMRKVKLPNFGDEINKSDMDIHIDPRYGEVEFHHIKDRLFARVILNSRISGSIINPRALLYSWSYKSSQEMKTTSEFIDIQGEDEQFCRFKNGHMTDKIAEGPGTFDKVIGMYGFAIGKVMEEIDRNIDVLIAPRLVRELEINISKAEQTVSKLEELGINNNRIQRDNSKHIKQSKELLEKAKSDMYRPADVEEIYFKIPHLKRRISENK